MSAVLLLTACGSSGSGGGAETSSSPEDSALPAFGSTAAPTDAGTVQADPGPSDIVNNYDTAACSDWKVTDPTNRKIVTTYFIVRAKATDLTDYEQALETAITTACAGFPRVSVKRVANLSIPELRKQIAALNGTSP